MSASCVYPGCARAVVGTAYGVPVCRAHRRRCALISNAERRLWARKQGRCCTRLLHVDRPRSVAPQVRWYADEAVA